MQHISFPSFLFSFIRPYWPYFLGIAFAMIFSAFHASFIPYLLKLMIDTITLPNATHPLILLASLFIGMEFLLVGAYRINDYFTLKTLPAINVSILRTMFNYVSLHSHNFFLEEYSGAISTKITDMASSVEELILTARDMIRQIVLVLVAAGMLLTIQNTFSLIILVWSSLFIWMTLYLSKKASYASIIFAEERSTCLGYIVDCLSNIMSVRLFAKTPSEQNRLKNHLAKLEDCERAVKWKWFGIWLSMGLGYSSMLAIVMFFLIYYYSHGFITAGDFTFVILISMAIIEPLYLLTEQIGKLTDHLGICKQAFSLISCPHDIRDKEDAKQLNVQNGKIHIDHVTFSYNPDHPLFNDLNLTIDSKEKVGLVGFSGAGKSSLVNLIIRLFDVQNGSISIDGQDIRDIKQESLRKNISFIPQDLSLFHRSLFENIQYGKTDATQEEIYEAATKAHAHEFIMKTPEKYDSLVGERGIKLSTGQRQRISMARAFLKNSPILILDEATNALDSITELYIQESLKSLMEQKTVLVIAHRLSTLLAMDRILVFDKGSIIEEGTHAELIKLNGLYTKLWNSQINGFLPIA